MGLITDHVKAQERHGGRHVSESCQGCTLRTNASTDHARLRVCPTNMVDVPLTVFVDDDCNYSKMRLVRWNKLGAVLIDHF